MRKTIIALMLILPLLFVFAIFSSVNIASLGVEIAANGISIVNKSEFTGGALRIDLADQANYENKLEVAVLPENATNKGYTFKVEEVEGSRFADVSVDESGKISAHSEGTARIFAVSNDGGYRDSVTVFVGSSKAYDFDFELFDQDGKVELSVDGDGNYSADIVTGRFTYNTTVYPSAFTVANVETIDGVADVQAGARTVTVPFSGQVVLGITVPDGVDGDIVKTVTLNATKASTPSGITVNGEQGNIIALAQGARTVEFYVEADAEPSLSADFGLQSVTVQKVDGTQNGYRVSAVLMENLRADFTAILSAGSSRIELSFTFKAFDFSLNADLAIVESDSGLSVSVLSGTPTNFYAVAAVFADDVTYNWGVDSTEFTDEILSATDIGATCVVNADKNGTFVLWVEAYRNGVPTGIVKEVTVSVISYVYGIQIVNDTSADLAARYTVGGLKYNQNGQTEQNKYLLDVRTFYDASGNDGGERSVADLVYSVSDVSKATVEVDNNNVWLVPQGTGEVTLTFAWKGNAAFGASHVATLTVNVVRNGVEVNNAPDLVKATKAGVEVVLTDDIMLGTDANGALLNIETRRSMIETMKSTYNIEWYRQGGNGKTEADAYVKFVMEFKDDVYGNGHYINAEHFTNAKDGTGMPLLFKGPLYFVCMGDMASVAGQDNAAFLVRSDGVTLYGVNLLGCSDESLVNDSGENDLSNLNNVGTVLEVNADAQIVNCRIRNGRNVVRVYGGNRDGNKYFINSLAENVNGVSEEERINVLIQGCIISQAREFLVKIGANRALRASASAGGQQPNLLDADGNPYPAQSDVNLNDEYFYKHYVMTDLTLSDSVLETSGLFAISIESNFAGSMLYKDAEGEPFAGTEEWKGTGGTSFAAVLRLVGDVRIYDWKDISLVDSSVLIEAGNNAVSWLKLDVAAMIDYVCTSNAQEYGKIAKDIGGKRYVHGGIVTYGGGKNYAQIDTSGMNSGISDLSEYKIKISVLKNSDDAILSRQGELLPSAAGDEAFRFFMYDAESANSYEKQLSDSESGSKYDGLKSLNVF